MAERRYVRVAVETPIPQLDRLFDYSVPNELSDSKLTGCRVVVPFGRGGRHKNGYVIGYTDTPEFVAKVLPLEKLISEVSVLTPDLYELFRAVADRQAATFHDVQRLAIPGRSVRIEKAWLENKTNLKTAELPNFDGWSLPDACSSKRAFILAEPRMVQIGHQTQASGWLTVIVSNAIAQLQQGKSSILVVPDFRDRQRLRNLLNQLGLASHTADFETDASPSQRYGEYLKTLTSNATINIGSRSAVYSPAHNLGLICVYDDSDQSLIEQASPYIASREVALIRQQQTDCQLLLVSNSVSCEAARLIEMGYLKAEKTNFAKPKIAFTEADERVDSTATQAIRRALKSDGTVLIQVASPGASVGTYCTQCSSRAQCKVCHGPLEMLVNQQISCRWCAALNLDFSCSECGGRKLRQGRAGSTRTTAEIGKSFPGVNIYEATGEKILESVPKGRAIVVSTPGSEPEVPGGYRAIVILDAKVALNRDTLRAREQAIRQWSNAISLGSQSCETVLVGVAQEFGANFALWRQLQLAKEELAQRREVGFPPVLRLASITAERRLLESFVEGLEIEVLAQHANDPAKHQFELLGPLAVEKGTNFRYLIRYDYALGATLAKELIARNLVLAAGTKVASSSSGRATRAVRIKMDEPEVI